ncbi:MAG: hypothetical protein JNN00_15880 [Chitinophagaceae bacterium]|nr:hypothetical protein [Chitinophagaceae bacterium]
MTSRIICILAVILSPYTGFVQDSVQLKKIPADYPAKISTHAVWFEKKLNKSSEKALQQMMRLEEKMKRRLAKTDSLKTKELFGNVKEKYKEFEQRLQSGLSGKQYIPSLDTLSTSLRFLQQTPGGISGIKDHEQKLKSAIEKVNDLETRFQRAEEIRKFLKERKQFLKDQLGQLGFAKELKRLNKQVYYYSEQMNEYKALLKDQKKAERKALELLCKTNLFKDFMRKNSMLASLFRMPGDPNDPVAQANLAGLQTRAQVNNLIQQQIAAGGTNAQAQFRQNLQEAQVKLNELKDKVLKHGGGSSDTEMPEGFKPNNQKTKNFWQRLEYGTNVQTQKATNFFPVTSDIGLSVGYKLNDKSIIGVGASYKMGLGTGWNNLQLTNQGVGLRSFIDWKIKGSFWISGGYEQTYKTAFSDFDQLRNLSSWQQSALVGLSKVVSLKTKFFKKTKVQLLWDFLSYEQLPRTQQVIFRINYNLN